MAADTLEPETRAAVRNASWLVAQRGLDIVRAVAFAALVPRLLGPADFGRFALLGSAAQWFAVLSGIGSAQLMGRFVPVMFLRDEGELARRLLGNLFALRVLTGTAAAAIYVLLAQWCWPDLALTLVAPVAAAVALGTVARVPFAFFLGLNRAARWGAGELVRRWSALALVVGGTLVGGVRGACVGLALTELCVLALGLRWVRPHLSRANLRLDREFLSPYLKYSLVFFGSNVLFALSQQGGEVLVRLADGDYAEVGYFGVAAAAWAVGAHGTWTVLVSFLPLLARLRAQQRLAVVGEWAGRLLKVVVAIGMAACFGAVALGADVVPRLVGGAFRPAAPVLLPLAVALVAHAAGSVGRLLTLALDRPRLALAAALTQAAVLVAAGVPLAARFGALGAAWAIAIASAAHAAAVLPAVRRQAAMPLAPSLAVVAIGGLFLPLTLLPVDGLRAHALVFAVFLAAYAGTLRAAGLVTGAEVAVLRRLLGRENA